MAKPDLDDGYLRLAHELFAAVMTAGFNKWELVVLREVFDQIYGPRKGLTAILHPTEIAGRAGTFKESIVRAIRTLIEGGVLKRRGEAEVAFIKDYEAWRLGESPRFSPTGIRYCMRAKRRNVSTKRGNKGAPSHQSDSVTTGTTALPVGNNGAPVLGAPALPVGNNGAPKNDIPPKNPYSGARAKERTEERGERKEGDSPSPPHVSHNGNGTTATASDPVVRRCLDIAAERWGTCNGDSVISDLLRDYEPTWVKAAMDQEWDKHGPRLSPAYLRAILQNFQGTGGPPRSKHENNGRTAVQQPDGETAGRIERPNLPRTPEFADFHRMWDEVEV